MASVAKRSYLGIGACALWFIATIILAIVFVTNYNAQHKLAGIEIIVVGPVAIVLYASGIVMAGQGLKAPTRNPLSRVGVFLNVLPFLLWLIAIVATNL